MSGTRRVLFSLHSFYVMAGRTSHNCFRWRWIGLRLYYLFSGGIGVRLPSLLLRDCLETSPLVFCFAKLSPSRLGFLSPLFPFILVLHAAHRTFHQKCWEMRITMASFVLTAVYLVRAYKYSSYVSKPLCLDTRLTPACICLLYSHLDKSDCFSSSDQFFYVHPRDV